MSSHPHPTAWWGRRPALAITAVGVATAVAVAGVILLPDGGDPVADTPPTVDEGTAPLLGEGGAEEGEPVPTVEFTHFDGTTASLADWEGEPVVLNFWASWCPPCVAEMSEAFEPVHAELGDEVAFVGANIQDQRSAAEEIIEQTGVTYTLVEDSDGELFAELGGFGMPTTVYISPEGVVAGQHTGALDREQLREQIDDYLLEG